MDYMVTNFAFDDAKQHGSVFYSGTCVKRVENFLKVRESSDSRFFERYADLIEDEKAAIPIKDAEDFYFCLDYDKNGNEIIFQTDIIGYESAYYYNDGRFFAISDDLLKLVIVLRKFAKILIDVDSNKALEYLAFGLSFFEDTFFMGIRRCVPATIYTYSLDTKREKTKNYDCFLMKGEIGDPVVAAKNIYAIIDEYFKRHYMNDKTYAIGMSGGLDSRVGAYFARKYSYEVKPIFIGRKKNFLGIITNDCKRAEDVNSYIGFKPIEYYDPRKVPFSKKVEYEARNAPNATSNISQNMCLIENIDCMINGIIGGEAFGAGLIDEIKDYNEKELSGFLAYRITNFPKYKSRFSRRMAQLFPFKYVKEKTKFKQKWIDDIFPREFRESVEKRVEKWVVQQRKLGLDNINIAHKFLYYRNAAMSKFSYYATLNNVCASLETFLNPTFIRQMLLWKSDMLIGKAVQRELLKRLDGLSFIRSQTIESSIEKERKDSVIKKIGRILERVLRGGGMIYTQWYSPSFLEKELRKRRSSNVPLYDLSVKKYWFKDSHSFVLSLIKLWELNTIITKESGMKERDQVL